MHAIYSLRGDKELKPGLIAPQLMSGIWKLKIEVMSVCATQTARRRHEVCNFPVGVSTSCLRSALLYTGRVAGGPWKCKEQDGGVWYDKAGFSRSCLWIFKS